MRSVVMASLVMLCTVTGSWADIPKTISYQGVLTDQTGTPVNDGTYTLIFRLYSVQQGGSALWEETHGTVVVEDGLFDVSLGTLTTLDLSFDEPYWVGITTGAGAELTPRIPLTCAPYSFNSRAVNGLPADTLPTPGALFPLDETGKFPQSVIPEVPADIPDGSITTEKLADEAVTSVKLNGDSVTSNKIVNGAVETEDIADEAVTASKIAPNVVSSIDGVSNDGSDIDLVGGTNVTITPDDAANTITINAAGGGGGDITAVWAGEGLWGGGDQGDVTLGVTKPLDLTGEEYYGMIKGTYTGWSEGYLGGYYGVSGSRGDFTGQIGTGSEGVSGYDFVSGCSGSLGRHNQGVYGFMFNQASDWAGFFDGDTRVNGFLQVTGDILKGGTCFFIDHPLDPENKLLIHACVESPENLLIYRGKIRLGERGEAIVTLPNYFTALAKEHEATVTLTPVGRPFLVGYQWRSAYDSFIAYGEPDREVSWVVYADRDDPVVHQLTRPGEVEKEPTSKLCPRGKLLYASAYGYPESMAAHVKEDVNAVEEIERAEQEQR